MLYMKFGNNRLVSEGFLTYSCKSRKEKFQRRRRLKMLTDNGWKMDACLYYKLTFEPLAQVSY